MQIFLKTFSQFQLYLWRWTLCFQSANQHFQLESWERQTPCTSLGVSNAASLTLQMTWMFITYNVDRYHMYHNASPFPTMVGSLSYPPNNNFWERAMTEGSPTTQNPWRNAVMARSFKRKTGWTPRVRASKIVPCPKLNLNAMYLYTYRSFFWFSFDADHGFSHHIYCQFLL